MNCSTACSGDVCIPSNFFDTMAMDSHFFSGAFAILGIVVFLRWWLHPKYALLAAVIVWTTFAAAKEFWYDEDYENSTERGSSWLDFGVYMTGAVVGGLLSIMIWPEFDSNIIYSVHGYRLN